jgi:hypothetical protein
MPEQQATLRVFHRKLLGLGGEMEKPEPKETKGVPWADHNETESTEADTRREEYGAEAPDAVKGDLEDEDTESADHGSSATERPTDEDRGDVEHDL